jgi:hypothetical protein
MADRMSDEDQETFRILAYVERTTIAEQRRHALAAYAKGARREKNIAALVGQCLTWRRQREAVARPSNVIELRGSRG